MGSAGKRKSYDELAPTLPSIMKYVELCHVWRSVSWLSQETGLGQSAVTRMCRRLHRIGVLDSTEQSDRGLRNEFRASALGRRIYDDILDGRVEMDVLAEELGPRYDSSEAVVAYLRRYRDVG